MGTALQCTAGRSRAATHLLSLSLQVVLHRVLSYSGVMLHLLQV